MKHSYLIVLSFLVALVFLSTTAAYATESVVFVDDDPVNSDGQTFYSGTWTQSTFFPQTYGQGYHFSTTTGGSLTMRALLDIDETGGGATGVSGSQFQAFARWSAGNNRCNAVRVEVRNASTNTLVTSEIVNQTTQGLQFNWTPIGGRFTATPNQLYEIRFISPGVCVTTVDGGMFVQQTYDSSDVFNLTKNSIVDEAGIDFKNGGSCSNIPTTVRNCDSITVSAPTSGWVSVDCKAFAVTFGEDTEVVLGVSAASSTLGESTRAGVLDGTDTKRREFPMQTFAVFPVSAGSRTFYCNAQKPSVFSSQQVNLGDVYMRAVFFPTGY